MDDAFIKIRQIDDAFTNLRILRIDAIYHKAKKQDLKE